jgi:diaminopimelate decarboxylase
LNLSEKYAGQICGQGQNAAEDAAERHVLDLVLSVLERSAAFNKAVESEGTPLYIFEPARLSAKINTFVETFRAYLGSFHAFYAMKCNPNPEVVSTAVQEGLGLDASSGKELREALDSGCGNILFSGPGKTDPELELAAAHAHKVTVLMDSFGELERLNAAAGRAGTVVRSGVRLSTTETGLWRKFGIPLTSLGNFLAASANKSNLRLEGLQFHTSWNMTPEYQTEFIIRLGRTLALMDPLTYRSIRFIDIGGGFWPERGEWLLGKEEFNSTGEYRLREKVHIKAAPIEDFAREIARTLRENIPQIPGLTIYAEPGRWIVDEVMHIVIKAVDRKGDDLVVADTGTNILGWERYETDYVPVVNLTRPSLTERPCLITGSLCTPHDIWGWSFFGDDIEPGDILLLPNQGAYTWSLRQEFIKPLAKVVKV